MDIYDSKIYGTKDLKNKNMKNCPNTLGIVQPLFGGSAQAAKKTSKWSKMISGGGSHGESRVYDVEFIGFDS